MPHDSQSDEKKAPPVDGCAPATRQRRRDRQSRIIRGPHMQQLPSPSPPRSPSPLVASMTEESPPPPSPPYLRDEMLAFHMRDSLGRGREDLSPSSMLQRTLTYLLQGMRFSDDDSLRMEDDVPGAVESAQEEAQEQAALDASEHEGMVLCQICLEEVPVEDTTLLTTCGHRFCSECFSRFLELKIVEGQVRPTCFHEEKRNSTLVVCGVAITTSDIQSLVSPDMFAKLERFRFNQQHKHARQCPYCEASQLCDGPETPQCVCDQCHREFCFTHGNAHDSTISCQKYDKRQLRSERRNRRKIKRICKPCPVCRSPVEKNGGCNHMRCLRCATDFCWLCGEKLSDLISDHYDWTNIRGCAGQQMVHIHGLTTTNKCVRYLSKLTLYVVVYPIAFVFTLLAMILSGFFVCCMCKADVTFSQVFRWMFYVIAISGYTALEFAGVTLITGVAATLFGVCWVFHELYKLGKSSVQKCGVWKRRTCGTSGQCCCVPPWRRTKQPTLSQLEADHVLVCDYGRMYP